MGAGGDEVVVPRDPQGIEGSGERTLGDFYLERLVTHMDDDYVGVRLRKLPEDLVAYEHLLWDARLDAVVELGTGHGGSALWFRDRLVAMGRYRAAGRPVVVSVDRSQEIPRAELERVDPGHGEHIVLIEGDVCDPAVAAEVRRHLPEGCRPLVVEDTSHRYETTIAALRLYADLVPEDGFFVAEDGHRDFDGMLPPEIPSRVRGVLPAVHEWLATEAGAAFRIDRSIERYLVTSNPQGWLRRTGGPGQ